MPRRSNANVSGVGYAKTADCSNCSKPGDQVTLKTRDCDSCGLRPDRHQGTQAACSLGVYMIIRGSGTLTSGDRLLVPQSVEMPIIGLNRRYCRPTPALI